MDGVSPAVLNKPRIRDSVLVLFWQFKCFGYDGAVTDQLTTLEDECGWVRNCSTRLETPSPLNRSTADHSASWRAGRLLKKGKKDDVLTRPAETLEPELT